MTANKTLLFAALAATVLTGCTNDEGPASVPDLAGTPIRIHTNLLERTLTRAGYQEGELKEGSFGLFLTTEGTEGDPRYNATNMQFSYDATANNWASREQLLWKNSNAQVSYYAYMPYDADATTNPASYPVTVPEDQNMGEEKIKVADFLYYKSDQAVTAATDGGAISIPFNHHLSYLTVKLKRLDTVKEILSVTLQGCATSATINLADGAITPGAANGNISLLNTTPSTGSTEDTYECILIPQDFQPMTILITGMDARSNEEKTYKYTSSATDKLTVSSGKSYTLTLNVGNAYVIAGMVSVAPWDTENGWTEQGDAKEVAPGPDEKAHSIITTETGQIAGNADWIKSAIGENGSLAISGPMNDADIAALKNYLTDNSTTTLSLDLTGAKLASIPQAAFRGVTGLVSIELPEGLTSIGTGGANGTAFSRCTGLQSVTFPSTLEVMELSSFWGCTSLTTIDLSNTKVATINAALFNGCSSLTSVSFGPNTNDFRNTVFVGCSSLTTIDLSLCEEVPTFSYSTDIASESPFYGLDMSKITIYVKDAAMKTAFENSAWVSRVGFSADNFTVKATE